VVAGQSYCTQGTFLRSLDPRTSTSQWEQPLPGDAGRLGGHLGSPPAVAGGRVVVGTSTGGVVVCDARSGNLVLRMPLGEEVRFQPTVAGGVIYAGTAHGILYALDTGDPSLDGWPMWGGGSCHNGSEPPVTAVPAAQGSIIRRDASASRLSGR
jgi:outer membrane protein assembly factor BamB